MGKPRRSKKKGSGGATQAPSKEYEKKNNRDGQIEEAGATASGSANALATISSSPAPATNAGAAVNNTRGEASAGKKKKKGKEPASVENKGKEHVEKSSGLIFMCNSITKPECYKHRVFGLPKGKLEMVERIKAGARLFLYDFNLKLLYGVYRSTSKGGLNLVAGAFGGKFPAQVKFKIDKDCLPLPESTFKLAIKENYESRSKFRPELNSKQVHKLLALFRPLSARPHPPPQYAEERRYPPISAYLPPPEDSFRTGHLGPSRLPAPGRIPAAEDPYKSGTLLRAPTDSRYLPLTPAYAARSSDPYTASEDPYRPGGVGRAPLSLDSRYVAPAPLPPTDPYAPGPQYVLVDARSLQVSHAPSVDPHNHGLVTDAYRQPLDLRSYHESHISDRYRDPEYHHRLPAARDGELDARTEQYPRISELAPRTGYLSSVYSDATRSYPDSRAEVANVPVSSRYSFAGTAPAYR